MKGNAVNNSNSVMGQLLEDFGHPRRPSPGSIVDATVIQVDGDRGYFVDFGGKVDGFVPAGELSGESLAVGSKSKFIFLTASADEVSSVLSQRQAVAWVELQKAIEEGTTIDIVVKGINTRRGGGIAGMRAVAPNGLEGFVPLRQLGFGPQKAREMHNTPLRAKVQEANPQTNRLIFNCEAVRQERQEQLRIAEEARDRRFAELVVGASITGSVMLKTEYGYFVDCGSGLNALLHNEEHDGSALEVGDVVTGRIKSLARQEGKRRVGMSTLAPLLERLKEGDVLTGVISNLTNYGAFVRLSRTERVDGLVHVSEMPAGTETLATLKARDSIKLRVIGIEHATRRVRLSLKDVG
jgi:small subunit ribosomal protein S1